VSAVRVLPAGGSDTAMYPNGEDAGARERTRSRRQGVMIVAAADREIYSWENMR
jgi:hypothetical protein